MGRPLIDRLQSANFDVTAFARREQVRDELVGAGISCVDDVALLARDRDVVVVYVYNDDQVRELLLNGPLAEAMEPGSVVVVHTTGSPRTVEAIDTRFGPLGVGVVDAPGSGGPAQVSSGSLTLFVGGHSPIVEQCLPLFEAYASQVVHFGGPGSGQKAKLLNNLLFGAHVELALEVARMSEAMDIDPVLLTDTLRTCSGASYALELLSLMGSPSAVLSGAGWTIHKDVSYALDLLSQMQAELGSFEEVVRAALVRTEPFHRDT
jgi:3-hydroxyisobutyrate dehydrogenase-like beta-hydroxyacid dehydrogenase